MEKENAALKTGQDGAIDNTELNNGSSGSENTEEVVDYALELKKALEINEKLAEERDNYKQGMLSAKGKLKAKDSDEEIDIATLVQNAVNTAIEPIKQTISKPIVDSIIDSFTTDPDKKALIKFHYENSIKQTGTTQEAIKEDIENALLIADKKVLTKKVKELSLSVANRSSMSTTGQGSGSKPTFEKEILSDEQINTLKKRGWDDEKIKQFKQNLMAKK